MNPSIVTMLMMTVLSSDPVEANGPLGGAIPTGIAPLIADFVVPGRRGSNSSVSGADAWHNAGALPPGLAPLIDDPVVPGRRGSTHSVSGADAWHNAALSLRGLRR